MLCKSTIHNFFLRINIREEDSISKLRFYVDTSVAEVSMPPCLWSLTVSIDVVKISENG